LLLLLSPALVEVGSGTGWTVYQPLNGITSHSGGAVDSAIPTRSIEKIFVVPTRFGRSLGDGVVIHSLFSILILAGLNGWPRGMVLNLRRNAF
ncbi:cytochrome oxidase subunit 1, partial [Tanacetum coccineum]